MEKEIRVSRDTSSKGLASSISRHMEGMKTGDVLRLKAIGASSVSQATKGIAIASSFKDNFQIQIKFENVMIESKECSALVWNLTIQ